jgi:hypothetical protein
VQVFKKEIKSIKMFSSLEDRYNEEISLLYENNKLANISYALDRD